MKWLVLIHVMSAIIGVGPTYFGHVFFRKGQTVGDLKHSLRFGRLMEFFPKIGGTIAVLSGLLLLVLTDWKFLSFWIVASIVLYVAIQVVVIAIVSPVTKRLFQWVQATAQSDQESLPAEQSSMLNKANYWYYAASTMGTLIFILMILKP